MSRLVLIDLSSIWWTNWHANAENEVRAPRRATLDAIKRIVGDGGDLVAICCDSGTSFRKELSPEYKANRPEKDLAALGEFDALKERLRADGYLLWECPGFEADDVIATAVHSARADRSKQETGEERIDGIRIASADKDLLQLLADNGPTDCLRTHSWQVVGVKEFREKYGIEPAQFGDWLALVGDASDNIKGCPGVGPKTATELLKTYKNLWALLAGAENFQPSIGKAVTASLNANRAQIELARKLVALRTDAPIDFAQVFEKREPKSLTVETAMRHEQAAVEAIAEADKVLAELVPVQAPSDSVTSLSLRDIVLQKKAIAECMRAVMKRGEHYGVVPGTSSKPSLFKPGADTLGFMFRLRAEYEIDRAVNEPDYIYYRVRCKLTHIPTGQLVATGMGSCNSRENKYRRPAPKKCPKCSGAFLIAGKPEYEKDPAFKGGTICYANKGGCGAKFKPGDPSIDGQAPGVADPSDLDNTILKMSMKRARVDATLTGTAAGDFFTQDIEDLDGQLSDEAA